MYVTCGCVQVGWTLSVCYVCLCAGGMDIECMLRVAVCRWDGH